MIKAIYHVYKACPIQTILLFFITITQGLFPSVNLYLTGIIVEAISSKGSVNNINTLLFFWSSTLIGVQILKPLENYFRGNVTELCTKYFNLNILDSVNKIEMLESFDSKEKYEQIEFLRKEASYRPLNFVVTISYLVRVLVTIISVSLVLWSYSSAIAIVMVFSIIPLLYINVKVEEANWKALTQSTKEAVLMKYFFSVTTDKKNLQDIRSYNMQGYLHEKYKSAALSLHHRMKAQRLKAIWWPIPAIIISCAGIIYSLLFLFIQDEIEATLIVVAFQSLIILRDNLNGMIEMASNLFSLIKFFNLFDSFIKDKPNKYYGHCFLESKEKYSINIENLTFGYKGREHKQINNLNIDIDPGEKVVIVGENGCGKSTLVKLLLGFYKPEKGSIILDNKEVLKIAPANLRDNISTVFQNYGEYHTSPFENIFFKEKKNNKEIKLAKELLKQVELELEPLTSLGKEFDGIELSGGMWQKLAVARSLRKRAGLYILDEFSSALDPIIEKKLFSMLLDRKATVIVITHRLYNIKSFDRILVMKNGTIIENGSYEELMSKKESFYRMWKAQNS